ncbi:MAG: AAA family ATPase [Deltaproteobacteria bacterium]|nr:AAA family ATPase [Deltaproteobacteria bacterium]
MRTRGLFYRARRATHLPEPAFVAREAELAVLDGVGDGASGVRLVYVYGAPGIGKTSLLRRFVARCRERGRRVTHLDARELEPVPIALLRALAAALMLGDHAAVSERRLLDRLARALRRAPHPLVIDEYPAADHLDAWVRDTLLPELPPGAGLVLATRGAPSVEWRAALGWPTSLRPLRLLELDASAARALLLARGAPRHEGAHALTRGHPLALALVADTLARQPDVPLALAHTPEVVQALVRRFVGDTTDPGQRAALEVLAVVRRLDEATLVAMVQGADARALFAWLAQRAFVEVTPDGLRPHDLVREVLFADLRWRAPERYHALVTSAVDHLVARFRRGGQSHRLALDVLYLHRSVLGLGSDWDATSELHADLARPADLPALMAMIERHEGARSAEIFSLWFERGLEVRVVRARDLAVVGFLANLVLERARPPEVRVDPVARGVWRALKESLRAGERALFVRWWMADDAYHTPSPTGLVLGSLMMARNFAPGLAMSVCGFSDEGFVAPMNLTRIASADYEVDGHRIAVYGLDFRRTPLAVHLAHLTRRMMGELDVAPPQREVLPRTTFDRAVRDALRHLHDPDRLAASPLVGTRIVTSATGVDANPAARGAALRRLVEDAVRELARSPRHVGLHAALLHTYLVPAVKQEVAADLAGLPFATYRRHLARAVAMISAALWQQEVADAP